MIVIRGNRRLQMVIASCVALTLLFAYVALRSGPMAPVAVTVETVPVRGIEPALFGVGIVDARTIATLGPTAPGRLSKVHVDVGDSVRIGQVVAEMDPVDLAERRRAQAATLSRSEALVVEARTRRDHARAQLARYAALGESKLVSVELLELKRQELALAEASAQVAHEDAARVRAELEALDARQADLVLRSPVDGLVAERHAQPGDALVAGQAVLEILDPGSLWVDTRFNQIGADGLAAGRRARIELHSRSGILHEAEVLRVDPLADAVTEELVAKVRFNTLPNPLPPIGELAQVTVALPATGPRPTIPTASIQRLGTAIGVWTVDNDDLAFVEIRTGERDLDGHVQVLEGLQGGETVVVYAEGALVPESRLRIVDRLPGVAK